MSLNIAVSEDGVLGLFLTGLVFSLLCFFAIRTIYVFARSGRRSRGTGARLGMAIAVLALLAGFALNMLPARDTLFFVLSNIIQGFGIAGFVVFLFFSVDPAGNNKIISRFFYAFFGAAGLFVSIAPVFIGQKSSLCIGAFAFLVGVTLAVIAVKRKIGGEAARSSLFACAGTLLIAGAMFVPAGELCVVLWAIPMLFALGRSAMSGGQTLPQTADDFDAPVQAEEDILPENAGAKMEMVEELAAADGADLPEMSKPAAASYKLNPFIPREFLRLLNKETVMDLKLGDHHEQEMTIFFSDIRQFTDFFESLSPEEGFKFINSYLTRIVPVIEQYGGFVDKYIGDAIMALFPQENGADMAVQSAIGIQQQMMEYNAHRAKCGYRPLEIGIGIHTGTLMLGVVGVHYRMQNTVISDAVNLASRVEGLTKAFGVSMAISGQTFQKLDHPENYFFRYLGNVKVKGKGEPTRVYEILNGISHEIMEKKKKTNMFFEQGLFSFVVKNYADALTNFNKVLAILPEDQASIMYREHCREKLRQRRATQIL